jgi:hypothetical protein
VCVCVCMYVCMCVCVGVCVCVCCHERAVMQKDENKRACKLKAPISREHTHCECHTGNSFTHSLTGRQTAR